MNSAPRLIEALKLEPHPEGGFFRETYRSAELIDITALPGRYAGDRCFSTAIYFLLEHPDFSAFHRIRSDELWHHYDGAGITIHVLSQDGSYRCLGLGNDMESGRQPQLTVPAGCWFAAETMLPGSYSLAGCTVSPGFDFHDFEMADRQELCRIYPAHKSLIERLTREARDVSC
ncbi:MAG: cupin domain-containing protein [Kiritimatiellia bacterium]|jgi:hypothetical protein|nr:cupin domain-containing protein [Kiritimatiellia bacterium]MDP6847398.1 cupin domain-containing protein [Kiritimatiellia bacterium]